MSTEVIMILLVGVLAAGTLLAGWAGIRSIQQARKVVFYRTRRSYMLAGWQWLVLALALLSSTVASAVFGEPVANQFLALSTQTDVVPSAVLATKTPTPFLTNPNERTPTPFPVLRQTQTRTPDQTAPEPVSVTATANATSTSTLRPTPTLPPTATPTITLTPLPSPTQNLSALATHAAQTLQAQLAFDALSHTPTRTKTDTPTSSFTPT
ncbi:MAG TPA: hypothetical protein VFY83_07660, partial [Anaerolineales bacterium]|nr:hypothetical protein [Anaerolineales bacterium]